nr:cation diffusion facilitator family transporter [Fredinandcohnia onubensis]
MGHHHHHHHHGHDHHGHHHHHHHHFDEVREGNKKGLLIALIITTGIMLLEFFGGLITNSLALLSDSGHMLSDASSLALSLVAFWFATRPASPKKTYGFYRFEILAALFNAVTLFVIAGFIVYEAFHRFFEPPTVASGTMMIIAGIGLLANILSAWSLISKGDVKNNVNLRSAYLHVLGDALGSVGAIIAGLLMLMFEWYIADPIISVVVAILILKSAWGVLTHSIHILMEGTPITIDQKEVKATLEEIEGVIDVHDLHIWTITSGIDSLTCHILIKDDHDSQEILQQSIDKIRDKFKIEHTTIQIEKSSIEHGEMRV